jgi:polysaccharide biosynthesis transport protein
MVPMEPMDDELDLRHYLDVVNRRKWLIIVVTVLVAAVAIGLSLSQTPMYRSGAQVLLQGDDAERRMGGADEFADARVNQNRVETEIGVIESNLVQDAVEAELGREPDVSVSAEGETDIIRISATSTEPEEAAAEANLYAETYVEWKRERTVDGLLAAQQTVQAEIDSLQQQQDELEAPLAEMEAALFAAETEDERNDIRAEMADYEAEIQPEITAIQSSLALYRAELSSLQVSQRITRTGGAQIISMAQVPEEPFEPQPLRNGVLGIVVGLMLGVGLAFLRETLDDRVRSRPTIGLIPVIAAARDGEHDLATMEAPNSPAAEAYRTLRTAVQFVGLERPLDAIQVTSAKPGEGKTTTAANLAIALAQAGKRVILLDADLRKPRLHKEFGIDNSAGFTSMLLDSNLSSNAFHKTRVPNLVVVPSGPPPPNPSELLSLEATRQVLSLLRAECDVLVIDSPPVLPVTDPMIISGYVDGVIVVANANDAEVKSLTRMRELLTQATGTRTATAMPLRRRAPRASTPATMRRPTRPRGCSAAEPACGGGRWSA